MKHKFNILLCSYTKNMNNSCPCGAVGVKGTHICVLRMSADEYLPVSEAANNERVIEAAVTVAKLNNVA